MMPDIDWKTKLLQVLRAFGDNEGTWHDQNWSDYGITQEEHDAIETAYCEYWDAHGLPPVGPKLAGVDNT